MSIKLGEYKKVRIWKSVDMYSCFRNDDVVYIYDDTCLIKYVKLNTYNLLNGIIYPVYDSVNISVNKKLINQ